MLKGCQDLPDNSRLHPIKNNVIYEVNIRQFTKEGTFEAFKNHLNRIYDLGVRVLWFMPIQPIGEENRKGSLGSYYSIKDYTAINPEFGSIDDFKAIVKEAHNLGMIVLLDWVAGHTARDHNWTESNPEYYINDEEGNLTAPDKDWTDVYGLNYENRDLWKTMSEEMLYWLKEVDIDGFRCDVAGMIPTPFWNYVRPILDNEKEVFMLAEWETADLHEYAFEMTYNFKLLHCFKDIALEQKNVIDLQEVIDTNYREFPEHAFRLNFITNHDENSWNGTAYERLKEYTHAMLALCFTLPGMPLVYGGQEAGLEKRLSFFDKDEIFWRETACTEFIKKLIDLKRNNSAIWNGPFGGSFYKFNTGANKEVMAFIRENRENKLMVIANLSPEFHNLTLFGNAFIGKYYDVFNDVNTELFPDNKFDIKPYEFFIYTQKK